MPKDRSYVKKVKKRGGWPKGKPRKPRPDGSSLVSVPTVTKTSTLPQNVFVVERIVDKRFNEIWQRVEYLIKWENYPNEENTWEPVENIIDHSVIRAFETRDNMKRIMGRRTIKGQIEYLVQWKDDGKTTWESPTCIYKQSLIRQYENRKKIEINMSNLSRTEESSSDDDSSSDEVSSEEEDQSLVIDERPQARTKSNSETPVTPTTIVKPSDIITQAVPPMDIEEQTSHEEEPDTMSTEEPLPSPQQPIQLDNNATSRRTTIDDVTQLQPMAFEGQSLPEQIFEPSSTIAEVSDILSDQAGPTESIVSPAAATSPDTTSAPATTATTDLDNTAAAGIAKDIDSTNIKAGKPNDLDLNNNQFIADCTITSDIKTDLGSASSTPPKLEDVKDEPQHILAKIEEAPGQIVAEVLSVIQSDSSEKMVANDIVLDKVELLDSSIDGQTEGQDIPTAVMVPPSTHNGLITQQARWDLLIKDAERQLKAGTILGSAKRNEKRVYLIEWADGNHQVLEEIEVKRDWPQMLIQFYERNINWVRNNEV